MKKLSKTQLQKVVKALTQKKQNEKFIIEVTDTFGGEPNFSWVRRYTVEAKSIKGAINKFAREYGAGWTMTWTSNDIARYDLKGACICCLVSYAE